MHELIEQIAKVQLNDTDKQVIAALAGSLIGAIVGAFSSYAIGAAAFKKQIKLNEIRVIRGKLRASLKALVAAENNIHNILIMTFKNEGHSEDIAKGIYNRETNTTTFSMNTPQPYVIENISDGLLSTQAAIRWTALEAEVMLHNSNILEFNDYYSFIRTSVHGAQLSSGDLNVSAIESDNRTVVSGAIQNIDACHNLQERCFKMLAIIQLQTSSYDVIDYTKTNLSKMKEHLRKASLDEPTKTEIDRKVRKLRKQYDKTKIFSVNQTF